MHARVPETHTQIEIEIEIEIKIEIDGEYQFLCMRFYTYCNTVIWDIYQV